MLETRPMMKSNYNNHSAGLVAAEHDDWLKNDCSVRCGFRCSKPCPICLTSSFQNGWLASGRASWCYATSTTWRTSCSSTTWPLAPSSRPSHSRSAASWATVVKRRTPRSSISLLPFYLQVRVFSPGLVSLKIRVMCEFLLGNENIIIMLLLKIICAIYSQNYLKEIKQ